jgi:hypothetical protein
LKKFENEFLIRLAATWLKCRWHVWHGRAYLPGVMMGMEDNAREMRLLCAEVLHK